MIVHRPAATRGEDVSPRVRRYRSFTFHTADPAPWLGLGALRVLDDCQLTAAATLPAQRHANMEILTWVLHGTLAIEADGQRYRLEAGMAHYLGAGSGTTTTLHALDDAPVRFLHVWLQPCRVNLPPAAAAHRLADTPGQWHLLASPEGTGGGLPLRQQAQIRTGHLLAGQRLALPTVAGGQHWLHLVDGQAHCAGHALAAGDALAIGEAGAALSLEAGQESRLLLVTLSPGASGSLQ